MTATLPAAPGDVLAVHGGGTGGWLVRVGEAVSGNPTLSGHVVIITHQDAKSRWMGIQGQPGGVGLVDCTPYLSDSRVRSNHAQPRANDHGQLDLFLAACAKTVGVRYDWVGIAEDVATTLNVPDLAATLDHFWRWPSDKNLLPGEMYCSNLAAWLYDEPTVNWAHPDLGTERACTPSDWWLWSDEQQWHS